jgi:hypothetical protein
MRGWFTGLWDRRRGWHSVALGALLAVATFHTGPTPASPGSPANAAAASNDVDALVLGRAASPILRAKRSLFDLNTVRRANTDRRHPRHYEMLIVDGDHLKPRALRRRATIRRFLAAERWVAAFDVSARHHEAIRRHTGFDVADGEEKDRSGIFLFRISTAEGSPTVEMLDSGHPRVRGAKHLGDRRKAELKRRHARRIARLAHRRVMPNATLAAAASNQAHPAASPQRVTCPPLDPAPDPELQHVGWCYSDAGQKAAPGGYWTQARKPWWIDPYSAPGQQTPTWTMNHRFDVFLHNDPTRPQGDFQTIAYSLNGQFVPKKVDERFFRMSDEFISGWYPFRRPWRLERAWWTGRAEIGVRPDQATDEKLIWQASHPESANSETQYTSGEEFSIGFSGTAAKPDAGLGVGVNASYTTSRSKTHSIPDWGVQNQSAGNDLRWTFSSRHPCDGRPSGNREKCFDTFWTLSEGTVPHSPRLPNELSRSNLRLNASGRWQTKSRLDAGEDRLKFDLLTAVTLADTYCESAGPNANSLCGYGYYLRESLSGPEQRMVEIDAAWVNPIPIAELRLSPKTADGAKREEVTGTVQLARAPSVPVSVRIVSDSENARLDGGSRSLVTIDPGKSSGTFRVRTNDNKLKSGEHTIASITAFYTEPTTEEIRIESR